VYHAVDHKVSPGGEGREGGGRAAGDGGEGGNRGMGCCEFLIHCFFLLFFFFKHLTISEVIIPKKASKIKAAL